MSPPVELRAADADRERTAETLRVATAEGRLSTEELEERLEAALGARTLAALEPVVADLPKADPVRRERRPRPRPRHRGSSERAAFLATAALLVAIWALTGAGYFWPVWPILGWGAFVLGPKGLVPFGACGARHLKRSAARRDRLSPCPPSASSTS
jgi:hypothetical protein